VIVRVDGRYGVETAPDAVKEAGVLRGLGVSATEDKSMKNKAASENAAKHD